METLIHYYRNCEYENNYGYYTIIYKEKVYYFDTEQEVFNFIDGILKNK